MTPVDMNVGVELELAQLRRLELAALVEATTLVLLVGGAVPLKHLAGHPEAVSIMGPVHGIAFCFYLWTLVQTVVGGDWRPAEWLRLTMMAFVPMAGYASVALIRRKAAALPAMRSRQS